MLIERVVEAVFLTTFGSYLNEHLKNQVDSGHYVNVNEIHIDGYWMVGINMVG